MTVPAVSPASVRRAVLASIIGNGFEWFDFLLYGFFTRVISKTFFPAEDPLVSTLLATATFALAFLVRPIGGVVLGLYADRAGRKPALTLMISLMAISSLMIGLTPGYASIGLAAPALVILARVLQGLSVGGEFAGATAMLAEYAPPRRKMLFGSLQMCSQALAISLSAFSAFALTSALPAEALQGWGWRIPFVLGALVGPVGFYIRRKVDESPEYVQAAGRGPAKSALIDLLRRQPGPLLAGFGVVVVGTVSNYLWFVYLPMFVVRELHLPDAQALFGSFVCGAVLFVLCLGAGALADRFGARRVFILGVVAFGALAYPLMAYVLAAPSVGRLLQAQLLCTLAISLIWGPTPGLMASLFPTQVRSTGMSISYNLGVLLFGGLAPFTLTWLISLTGDRMTPAYYIIAAALIALTALGATARATREAPAAA